MHYKTIDMNIQQLFRRLEETGIPLDEEKLINLIRGCQKKLAEQKQMINREVGFIVNLHSEDHWNRAIGGVGAKNFLLYGQLLEARKISYLIRKLQQVHALANGNFRVLDRQFGLYPKYRFDLNRRIITTGELSLEDLPEEVLGVVSSNNKVMIKATYCDINLDVIQGLSGDPWVTEATAMDLIKIGFMGLFEDYRIEKLGAQIFAAASHSIYLFAPDYRIDLILAICKEDLEHVHSDFVLHAEIRVGKSFAELV